MPPCKKDSVSKAQTKKAATEEGKPKRPLSGYMRFCGEKRESVKTANPGMKVTEILSEMGKLWKELDQDKKAKYNQAYEADKKDFEEVMAEWKETHPEEKKAKKAAKKPAKKIVKKPIKKAAKKDSDEDSAEDSEPEDSVPEESENESVDDSE